MIIWNVALRYAGKLGGFKLAAGIGYGEQTEDDEECAHVNGVNSDARCEEWGASASIMHVASGLFVTGSYGWRQDEARTRALAAAGLVGGDENEYYHIQAGIEQKWTSLGRTTIFGGYYDRDAGTPVSNSDGSLRTVSDGVVTGVILNTDVEIWELGLNQEIKAAAMDMYLHYKHYEADITTTGGNIATEDFQTVIGGARIKF